jgi:hypothetical protein
MWKGHLVPQINSLKFPHVANICPHAGGQQLMEKKTEMVLVLGCTQISRTAIHRICLSAHANYVSSRSDPLIYILLMKNTCNARSIQEKNRIIIRQSKLKGRACVFRTQLLSWRWSKGRFRCNFFLQNDTVANFGVIWQLVSNHDLIRLKRFVSSISSKLCN